MFISQYINVGIHWLIVTFLYMFFSLVKNMNESLKTLIIPTDEKLYDMIKERYKDISYETVSVTNYFSKHYDEFSSRNSYNIMDPDMPEVFEVFFNNSHIALILTDEMNEDIIRELTSRLKKYDVHSVNVGIVYESGSKKEPEYDYKNFCKKVREINGESFFLMPLPNFKKLYKDNEELNKVIKKFNVKKINNIEHVIMPFEDEEDLMTYVEDEDSAYTMVNPSLIIYHKNPLINSETMIDNLIEFDFSEFDNILRDLTESFVKYIRNDN